MAYILNIETATKNCSVSLAFNGQTIAFREIAEEGYSHAERLHVFIEQVMTETSISLTDLSAVAVSQGPGSYTGLRIGVSAAKGLCFSLGIPLFAIDTLHVIALQAKVSDGLIIPMLDARRMEVYSAIFTLNFEKKREVRAEIITEDSFKDIKGNIYFIGDCAQKCKVVLTQSNHIFLENIIYPSAREMSMLSYEKFINNDTVDVAYFEPFYLKDFLITKSTK